MFDSPGPALIATTTLCSAGLTSLIPAGPSHTVSSTVLFHVFPTTRKEEVRSFVTMYPFFGTPPTPQSREQFSIAPALHTIQNITKGGIIYLVFPSLNLLASSL